MIIDVAEGVRFDSEKESFFKNGKHEIHLSGSREAIRELGKYLIALTEYETTDPNYHDHFDDIINRKGEKKVDLIVYRPNSY